jgi:hypothetical protein
MAEGDEKKPAAGQIWARIWQVATSGLFFMVVGCVFLVVAGRSMGTVHAALSFVLVVLGSAILLFGTGTQGMGDFTSPDGGQTALKYKVSIAGGAGILALAIGLGMVIERNGIQDVFQIEKRFVRVVLSPQPDQFSTFKGFVAEARTAAGTPIPVMHPDDNRIELFVPYFPNQIHDEIVVHVVLSNVTPQVSLSATVPTTVHVNIGTGTLANSTGSLDFPLYVGKPEETVLNMQSKATIQAQLSGTDAHQESGSGRQPPNQPEAINIQVQ